MIDLHRILVPIDFSKHSHKALIYAASFAEKFAAELHLLHILQDYAVFFPDPIAASAPALPPADQLTTAARTALDRLVQENKLQALRTQTEVRQGTPYQEIADYAREKEIDLIVMGTHGRTGLVHLLLGSITEKVIRWAPCPVLTVRDPEHEFVHP